MKLERRAKGQGSVIFLGDDRNKQWGVRITIGTDKNGNSVKPTIQSFERKIDALVWLEEYNRNPFPLYIKRKTYERVVTFPANPYPLIPVDNIGKAKEKVVKKEAFTFREVYEELKALKFPTEAEIEMEKEMHIKAKGKIGYNYARSVSSAYKSLQTLHDRIYKDLRASDFNKAMIDSRRPPSVQQNMVHLFNMMDNYALQEDIIDKGYARYCIISNYSVEKTTSRKPFTYEQIEYLWHIDSKDQDEMFVRDFLLLTIYTGMRAEELLFIYTKNIYLNQMYLVGGLKTKAGRNREIPIHPRILKIIKKYYNPNNEFLFMNENERFSYNYYLHRFTTHFKKKHPLLEGMTAHCGRHTLRTELENMNVKNVVINSIMGHSNENVGEDVYTHISLSEKQEAINSIIYRKKEPLHLVV